jgi:hypothetical protein
MFWKRKELTYDEELAITVQQLEGWVDFIEMEIAGEADDAEIGDLGDMTVATAKRHLAGLESTLELLKPMVRRT